MIDLAVDALAAYRLTRLVTRDTITRPARAAVIAAAYGRGAEHMSAELWEDEVDGDPHPPALAKLITCSWCASVWVGAGVMLARRLFPRAWQPCAYGLACAAVAGLAAAIEPAD